MIICSIIWVNLYYKLSGELHHSQYPYQSEQEHLWSNYKILLWDCRNIDYHWCWRKSFDLRMPEMPIASYSAMLLCKNAIFTFWNVLWNKNNIWRRKGSGKQPILLFLFSDLQNLGASLIGAGLHNKGLLISENNKSCFMWAMIFKCIEESMSILSFSPISKLLLFRPAPINNIPRFYRSLNNNGTCMLFTRPLFPSEYKGKTAVWQHNTILNNFSYSILATVSTLCFFDPPMQSTI